MGNVFTLRISDDAKLNRYLQGTMDSFGRHTVSYTPSNDPAEYLQIDLRMSISSEATLPDMLNFFTDYLRASGYVFEGSIQIIDTDKEEEYFESKQYWCDKFFKLLNSKDAEEEVISERDFWKGQTYKLLEEEKGDG